MAAVNRECAGKNRAFGYPPLSSSRSAFEDKVLTDAVDESVLFGNAEKILFFLSVHHNAPFHHT